MKGVVVDLETMGDGSDAPIIALGAVKFDSSKVFSKRITSRYYGVIDLQTSTDNGGMITPSTVIWWMNQSDDARSIFNKQNQDKAVDILAALLDFKGWLGKGQQVWGNGASFDNPILANAYKSGSMEAPWKFWDDRCYRTLKALHSKTVPVQDFVGIKHHALADAEHQAVHLCEILIHMGVK